MEGMALMTAQARVAPADAAAWAGMNCSRRPRKTYGEVLPCRHDGTVAVVKRVPMGGRFDSGIPMQPLGLAVITPDRIHLQCG